MTSLKARTLSGPIKTSILGTGMSLSVFHEPSVFLLPEQFQLHSIYERTPKGRLDPLHKAGKLEGVKIVRSLEEVVEDKEVELVVISTPNNTHYEYAKLLLENGKHVLIEKPICPTSKEAEELYEIAEKNGLIVGVYQNRRWDSDFLTLRELIDSGKLGEVLEVTSSFDRYRPLPSTYKAGENWKETPGESNNSIYNLGSHLIDQAVVLFGQPEKISGKVWDSRGIRMDENFVVNLYYPPNPPSKSPRLITLKASILSPLPHQLRYLVKGSKGSYVKYTLPSSHPALSKYGSPADHEGFDAEPKEGWGTAYIAKEEKDGADFTEETVQAVKGDYIGLYKNLADTINSGDRSTLSVKKEEVLSVLRIIELARKSSDEGKVLLFSK
ncbi:uncharacterized protein I303_101625 [Kwoniella dejecticola CBS 10117]|uniref:Oxidoreductase n=1 Tax=Kwoniella dejecticola CBS 10117 TaxID=1296121 RepID=A0A1A6AD79_9TREE|nr:uncharacterized protein I303_02239 [Kwoniella dejecticola CBS 10117]OBR88022.1 hypothetical protein I303_02239 [Kwoniella dejecticola CBS 10117]